MSGRNIVYKNALSKSIEKSFFIPIIQDTKVIQLGINGRTLPLKESISLNDFTEKLLPLLRELELYVDLTCFSYDNNKHSYLFNKKWDISSFKVFWIKLSERQKEIIIKVYENKQISREKLVDSLLRKKMLKNEEGLTKKLAGLVAGMTRKWNSLNFEPIWYINNGIYLLNPNIKEVLQNFFKEKDDNERNLEK